MKTTGTVIFHHRLQSGVKLLAVQYAEWLREHGCEARIIYPAYNGLKAEALVLWHDLKGGAV